jgi:hypothetical protein
MALSILRYNNIPNIKNTGIYGKYPYNTLIEITNNSEVGLVTYKVGSTNALNPTTINGVTIDNTGIITYNNIENIVSNFVIVQNPNQRLNGTFTSYLTTISNTPGSSYNFDNFMFTTAGLTGPFGPTLLQLQNQYNATSWTQNTNYLNILTQGIQLWTVPVSGNYRIIAAGAKGSEVD